MGYGGFSGGRGRVRRGCGRTPPLPKGISPPRGGEIGTRNFLPQRGERSQRDRGGAGGRRGAVGASVGAVGAPPLCLRHLPPKGGRKFGAGGRSPHGSEMSRCVRNFFPQRGERSQRDRGGAGGRRRVVGASVGAARVPPSALRHLPPKGGEKIGTRNFLPPLAGGDVATRQRGAGGRRTGGGRFRRRCARTPLCLSASPPQGGEKGGLGIFSPRLRGEMSQRDRGGRAGAGGW